MTGATEKNATRVGPRVHALFNFLSRTGLLAPVSRLLEAVKIARFRARGGPAPAEQDGVPLPPLSLIHRVAGTPDVQWFLEAGRRAAESLRRILGKNGLRLEDMGAVLDFGCGSGRVLRHLKGLPRTRLFGCDYNSGLVDWCKANIAGFATVERNGAEPPFPFPDASFDFVYALSVLTHMPEGQQAAWMREVLRVLRPGGHFAFSTHGEHYRDALTAEERALFDAGRPVVRYERYAGSNLCGSFHPFPFIRDVLAKGYALVDFIPKGAEGNPHQDLTLLRKL